MKLVLRLGGTILFMVVIASSGNAQVMTSLAVAGETGSFSDGSEDYFGLVDTTGTMIGGSLFVADHGTRITGCSMRYNFARVSQQVGLRERADGYRHGCGRH